MKRVGFLDDWQKEQAKLGRIQDLVRGAREGGGCFLVKDYWGCAAGWGRVFTTGSTLMGLNF